MFSYNHSDQYVFRVENDRLMAADNDRNTGAQEREVLGTGNWLQPDQTFLITQAGEMLKLLVMVNTYPPGYPISLQAQQLVQDFCTSALDAGLDLKSIQYTFDGKAHEETPVYGAQIRSDDMFLLTQAGEMLKLLGMVERFPLGTALSPQAHEAVQQFCSSAIEAGIDIIGVSESP